MTLSDHHWIGIKPDTTKTGFVYSITRKSDGKIYIGQKIYWNTRRKKVRCKTNTNRKTQVQKSESNWRVYTGSSVELNKDIETLGKDAFVFTILSNVTGKGKLNQEEAFAQLKHCLINYAFHNTYNKMIKLTIRSGK